MTTLVQDILALETAEKLGGFLLHPPAPMDVRATVAAVARRVELGLQYLRNEQRDSEAWGVGAGEAAGAAARGGGGRAGGWAAAWPAQVTAEDTPQDTPPQQPQGPGRGAGARRMSAPQVGPLPPGTLRRGGGGSGGRQQAAPRLIVIVQARSHALAPGLETLRLPRPLSPRLLTPRISDLVLRIRCHPT